MLYKHIKTTKKNTRCTYGSRYEIANILSKKFPKYPDPNSHPKNTNLFKLKNINMAESRLKPESRLNANVSFSGLQLWPSGAIKHRSTILYPEGFFFPYVQLGDSSPAQWSVETLFTCLILL